MLLGILVVTFSMVASSVTTTESVKRSCPSWAGFSLAFSGVVGIVSWKRPFTLVVGAKVWCPLGGRCPSPEGIPFMPSRRELTSPFTLARHHVCEGG